MPPRSLVDMCLTVASQNINNITGLYGMPDPLKRLLLRGVTKADQLRAIEEDDEEFDGFPEHWQRLIAAHFPDLARQHQWVPKDPKHWSRVYAKYKKTNDDIIAEATQTLAAKLRGATQTREEQKLRVKANLTKRLPPPPQPKKHWSTQSAVPSARKSALSKLRTQVRSQVSRFKAPPINHQGLKLGHVERAPQRMINEARVARQPELPTTRAFNQAPGNGQKSFNNESDKAREEREQRLRQIKSQGAAPRPPPNILDFDSDETTNSTHHPTLVSATPGSNQQPQSSATIPSEPSTAPARRRRPGLLSASPGANQTHSTIIREKNASLHLSPPPQRQKRPFSGSDDDSNSHDGPNAPKRQNTGASAPLTKRPGSGLSAAPGASRTHGHTAASSPPSGSAKREDPSQDVKQILDKLSGPKFTPPAPPRKRPILGLVQPKRTFRR